VIVSSAEVNAGLLSAIVLLILVLLGLSTLQKWTARKHPTGSIFVNKAAPIARWLLGLLIAAYVLFIAFQMQH
jgi:hypothetical protein